MKTFLLLLLACVSVAAADTGVRFFTSTSKDTATPGGIIATETYTRDGEQDLIRIAKSLNGAVTYQSHGFYHDGKLVPFTRGGRSIRHLMLSPKHPITLDLNSCRQRISRA